MELESSGDVLILPSVSRKDSGIYQCRPLDAVGHAEVKGEMQLTVHCKKRHAPVKQTFPELNTENKKNWTAVGML